MSTLRLDGRSLTLGDLAPLFEPGHEGRGLPLTIDEEALERCARARRLVERAVDEGRAVYGLTTGFGKLKNVPIAKHDLEELQRNLVLSHCCGVGDPMPPAEVKAVQLLRLNGLLRGHSGVRVELLEQLARLFAGDFVPFVPQQGSVGASGDLAPLAHMAAAYMGVGKAFVGQECLPAAEALERVGERPMVLTAKEGLALINGTEVMAGIGVGAALRAIRLSKTVDVVAALTIESLFGSLKPFDERLAGLKGQPGHVRTAANIRSLLASSEILDSHVDCDRVQDPYSLRCIPQVHGAVKEAIAHTATVLAPELNSVTDNPLLFPETDEVISAGQFHGQPISMVLDYLGLALCTLSNISERRVEQLVNPDLSRLPSFLAKEPGLHSGMMIAQVVAASLASENKVWAHPASVDTIPTSANQEDHVSMGVTAARKLRSIVENVERVVGIEYLCAAQAREFHPEMRPGPGAQAAYEVLRATVPAMDRDRFLHEDIEAAARIVRGPELLAAVEAAVGPLEA